jgi:hypothetical protein
MYLRNVHCEEPLKGKSSLAHIPCNQTHTHLLLVNYGIYDDVLCTTQRNKSYVLFCSVLFCKISCYFIIKQNIIIVQNLRSIFQTLRKCIIMCGIKVFYNFSIVKLTLSAHFIY